MGTILVRYKKMKVSGTGNYTGPIQENESFRYWELYGPVQENEGLTYWELYWSGTRK